MPAVQPLRSALVRTLPFVLLLALSAALHFAWYAHPASVVFDEVYFPRFGLAYLKGEYFFDLHPPLGKLIFAATGWLAGLDPGFAFASIHQPFPDASYVALRVPPRMAGTLLPLVLVGIAFELGLSRLAAFTVGALAVLDNGLLSNSRIALVDPFLLLAGFGALWCWLLSRTRGWGWTAAAGLLAGAALAVKWSGLAFLGLVLLGAGLHWLRARSVAGIGRIALMIALSATVYVASFAVHYALLTRGGPDAAHMSAAYQANLAGTAAAADPAQPRASFGARLVELHRKMFGGHQSAGPHPYGSRWYDWPFMMRGIAMWTQGQDGTLASIHLLGNPAVWWASGYAILLLLVNFPPRLFNWAMRRPGALLQPTETMIVIAWLANMLPFVLISRVMFVYHYLPALCIALLGLGHLIDRSGRDARWLAPALIALAAAGFVYFAPVTYGLTLTHAEFDARMWLRGWR